MTEPMPDTQYTATYTPVVIGPTRSVSLVVDRDIADFIRRLQTLRNQARRGEVDRLCIVDALALRIGPVIAVE